MINFISHESFPDDPYIKEIVYICFRDGVHDGYIRKCTKNGNMFWSPMGCGVMKNGEKKFYDGIELDSNFLKKDILAFLEARSWEVKQKSFADCATDSARYAMPQSTAALHQKYENSPAPAAQRSFADELPF
jgi:hypothetical protein